MVSDLGFAGNVVEQGTFIGNVVEVPAYPGAKETLAFISAPTC